MGTIPGGEARAAGGGASAADLERLWRLQLVDGSIRAADRALGAHPDRLQAEQLARDVAALEDEVRRTQEKLKEGRVAARRAEAELKAAEQAAAQLQARLFGGGVTNPKELSSLQSRFESTRSRVDRLQDEVLGQMIGLEETEKALAGLDERLKDARARLSEAQARWDATRAELERQAAELRKEREALAAAVSNPTYLTRYERLSAAKGGQALAVVDGERCSGCGVPLSTLVLTEARRKERMIFCEVCGRILYWPPAAPGTPAGGPSRA